MDYLLARYGQQHFNNEQNSYGRIKLRRICVRTRSEAQELLSQIREDGAGFPELAALHSIDPHDRLTQGDLGLVHLRELPEELQRLLKGAAAGAVIGPLHGAGIRTVFCRSALPGPV